MQKNALIYYWLSQAVRIFTGPLLLLFLAKYLSVDELGFYYSFFSVQASGQLLEAGMGFVMMQSFAKRMNGLKFYNGTLLGDFNKRLIIYKYFFFLISWQFFVSIAFLVTSSIVGFIIFHDYTGSISWEYPLILLIIAGSINLYITCLSSITEGFQRPDKLYRIGLISGLCSSLSMMTFLYFDFGLYSIGLSQIISATVTASLHLLNLKLFLRQGFKLIINEKKFGKQALFDIFLEIRPYFSRTSLTWITGYFYWNSLNLLSFKLEGAAFAGKLGFTLALIKAVSSLSESFVTTKRSYYVKLISDNQHNIAIKNFRRNNYLTLSFFLIGVSLIIFIKNYDILTISEKLLSLNETVFYCIGYLFIVLITNMALYIRSHFVEPFVIFSISQSVLFTAGIYITLSAGNTLSLSIFFLCLHFVYFCWCFLILREYVQHGNYKK